MVELVSLEPEPHGEGLEALLEKTLEEVRAGEVSSLAIAIVYRSGILGAKWSHWPSFGMILGAVERLKWKLQQAQDDQA
jgi:hypothetical protein